MSCVLWKDLKGVENRSIDSSIRKFCKNQPRQFLEKLSANVALRYLLAILNSKYAKVLLGRIRCGDYHIYAEYIRNIPIPVADAEQQRNVSSLVDRILAAKKADPDADTSALEAEIDKLVYRLYDLTPEEIAVVESSSK